jgi:O-antigen ligase
MALTALAFLMFFFGGLLLAFAIHPRFGLYAYLAVFYLHPPSRWWGDMLPDIRWSLVAAVVTLLALVRLPPMVGRPKFLSLPPVWLLIAFTLWVWVQNAWALDRTMQLDLSILLTKYVVLFYLIYRLVDSPHMLNNVLFVHVLGCFFLGWLAYQAADAGRLDGVGGPGIGEANALAMHVSTGVFAAAYLILHPGRWWVRLASLAAMPFMLNVIIQSESRSAVLAFLAGGLVFWYFKPAAYRKLFYAGAAVGVLAVAYLGHAAFWERIATIQEATSGYTEEADASARSRWAMAELQLRVAADNPFGVGHRGIVPLSKLYLDERYLSQQGGRSSHNTYLTVLSEQGLPGALIFGALLAWALRSLWRMRDLRHRPELTRLSGQVAAIAAMLAVAAVGGIGVDYLKAEVQIWAIALLTVLSVAHSTMYTVMEPRPVGEPAVEGLRPARWFG